jgi:hypothetical protein
VIGAVVVLQLLWLTRGRSCPRRHAGAAKRATHRRFRGSRGDRQS